jgi:hypothetical protein
VTAETRHHQVASEYGLEKAKAQRDMDGRHNLTLTANDRTTAISPDGLGRSYRPATAMEGDKNDCIDFR